MKCPNCNTSYETEVSVCTTCKYPFSGTATEKSSFIAQQVLKGGEIDSSKDALKRARSILFIIGGIILLTSISRLSTPLVFIAIFLVGSFFLFCGFILPKRKQLVFLVSPTIMYFVLQTFLVIDNPDLALSPNFYYMVLLFGGGLIYAIVLMYRANALKKESEYLSKK